MAPNGDTLVAPFTKNATAAVTSNRPRRISMEGLQRAISDLSFQLSKKDTAAAAAAAAPALVPISEVEDAACECCGMKEECTPEYIRRVRDRFAGRWICGLCAEAVKEEMAKNGGRQREAVEAHVNMCIRFNRFGRTKPVLSQANAMREILKKRVQSPSPRERDGVKKGTILRSSSCIPAISKDIKLGKKFED